MESNNPSDTGHQFSTFVEVLQWRARQQSTQPVYTYLSDGEDEKVSLTARELDHQARAIGALLQQHGATGERVLLLYPPGLDFIAAFFGCLYAGAIAVPVLPPHPVRPQRALSRLQAIVSDAQPSVALMTSRVRTRLQRLAVRMAELETISWLTTDQLASDLAQTWQEPTVTGTSLAFLQYTSGSTATPKGVMVSQANLLHNCAFIHQGFENRPDERGVFWLPFHHDMGLIGGILQTLCCGGSCTLLSPLAFLQRPVRWLQAISRTRATISGAPNFAYELCVRKITPEQRASLDLRSWAVAFNGAEPVQQATLERFSAAFASCGFRPEAFYPCYGLAEASLFVSGGCRSSSPVVLQVNSSALEHNRVIEVGPQDTGIRSLVGCGQVPPDQQIIIVDPEGLTRCPPNQVGEIWVTGPSVAQGYWNRPEDTVQTFGAHLSDTREGPFLRTGDLGFVKDGELFVTGRLKDLIIIDGSNHYPQDIEQTIEQTLERSHAPLRPHSSAVFSVEQDGAECLVVMQEVERRADSADPQVISRPSDKRSWSSMSSQFMPCYWSRLAAFPRQRAANYNGTYVVNVSWKTR